MAFPSVLSTISTPNPTDKLNAPSHSGIEGGQNQAIVEIENFIGTLSSVAGTLLYDIRSPLSNGGGHIQTPDKGGTGQTSFNKGDLLVGQSSSVVTKVAVGSNNQVLVADSTQQAGVKWVSQSASVSMPQTSVFSGAAPTSFTDLDLSGIVGVNSATVLLKVVNNSTFSRQFAFRKKGDTDTENINNNSSGANRFNSIPADMSAGYVMLITDSSGVIQWAASGTTSSIQVLIQAYWK